MWFHNIDALPPLAGGALIGAAAALYLATHGRIAGISGLVSGVLSRSADWMPRAAFLVGLAGAGAILAFVFPVLFEPPRARLVLVVVAGLLVGFGTRLGNGCTSGHGVCGVGRFSARSIAATLTFVTTGAATVAASRFLGGAP